VPNSYTSLHYHVVFSTKRRAPQLTPEIRERLIAYVGGIIRAERGVLLAGSAMPDHVHLLMTLHPQTCVSDVMRVVKTNSSKWVHETFTGSAGFGWQDGYAAFSVSASNVESVKDYIAEQERHHAKMTFQEELITFLDRHGVPYDERYIWK